MGRKKIYQTEEERKEAKRIYDKKRYQEHREKRLEQMKEYNKQYYQENREKELERKKEYKKEYYNTPIGRAVNLVQGYKQKDKKYNRGECTLTARWVVDNIFSKPCHYNCGKKGWELIGCDRINNDLPHTPDNVVPCCEECNKKRHTMDYEEFLASSFHV